MELRDAINSASSNPYFDGNDDDPMLMKKASTDFKLGVSAAQEAAGVVSSGVSRIVGGQEAGPNQFPYYGK